MRIEPLEIRDVPATILGPTMLSYQDVDGDTVTVAFSRPLITPFTADEIFSFDSGSVDGNNATPQRLLGINLAGLPAQAKGTDITVTALTASGTGNGRADVGAIWADAIDLGDIAIDGDLGTIQAGNAVRMMPGVRSLLVHSIGANGVSEFEGSMVTGRLGSLTILHDFVSGNFTVTGGAYGSIGELYVGGDVRGGLAVEGRLGSAIVVGNLIGEWTLTGGAGTVEILGSILPGSEWYHPGRMTIQKPADVVRVRKDIAGGSENGTGMISIYSAKTVDVGGSVIGGLGHVSGVIEYSRTPGTLTVAGDVVGGSGDSSGRIDGLGLAPEAATIRIHGSVIGGAMSSGGIYVPNRSATVYVGGDVVGGGARDSGMVYLFSKTGTLHIGGDVLGGTAKYSGSVWLTGNLQSIRVDGDIVGGSGEVAGNLYVEGRVRVVRIYGGVIGGGGPVSGLLQIDGNVNRLDVFGDVIGGTGAASAQVDVWTADRIAIHGNIVGGSLPNSGAMFMRNVNTYLIGGDLIGGTGPACGYIQFNESLRSFTVRGSIVGGSAPSTGRVEMYESAGSVLVGGDIIGGTATADGQDLTGSGSLGAQHGIGKVVLDGSLLGADNGGHTIVDAFGAGAFNANWNIGTIQIGGDVRGRSELARISAGGVRRSGKAIGSLSVLGSVERADILVGYSDFNGWGQLVNPTNGKAKVGSIRVAGDWIASNLCVGVDVSTGLRIQSADPSPIRSSIDSIWIGGNLDGTTTPNDIYRIAAQQIGSITIANQVVGPLNPGPSNDELVLGNNGDVLLKEVS